jgi:hypothetical protein
MPRQSVRSVASTITVGPDLGDRFSRYSEMDFETGVIAEGRLHTTPDALRRHFAARESLRIVMEVGPHSPWVSRLLEATRPSSHRRQRPQGSPDLRQRLEDRQGRCRNPRDLGRPSIRHR